MRRSTILSLPFQLEFPGSSISGLFWSRLESTQVDYLLKVRHTKGGLLALSGNIRLGRKDVPGTKA
jgi:hypothetical protein